jgi:ATP-dependent Lhr-like helicase
MVELLAARWVEPPLPGALHLSTAVQQILSAIAQTGGLSAQRAYRLLCETGPFSAIGQTRFAHLLRDLGNNDLISQTHDGTLVLGLTGERLVSFFDFYASFSTPEEWRLIANGRELGTLPVSSPIAVDSFLIFGGKRWRIVGIEEERRTIQLERAPGGNPPVWNGEGALVHGRVREAMRAVFTQTDVPAFLNEHAKALLAEGRYAFAQFGLAQRAIVRDGHDAIILPWASDRALDTITLALRERGVEVTREGCALVAIYRTPREIHTLFQRMAASPPPDPLSIAGRVENLRTQKHHRFLSYPLLLADFASSRLDVPAAWEAIAQMAKAPV